MFINISVPKNVSSEDSGLYIVRYNCQFGEYNALSLCTNNENIVKDFTKFSRNNGYSIKWKSKDDMCEVSKIPMALLVQVILCQSDYKVNKLIGAWSISSGLHSTALNVVSSIKKIKKNVFINKFSLFYSKSFDINKTQIIPIVDGISFRTAIFDAKNISEARYNLLSLSNKRFSGIVIDGSEDAIYPKNSLSSENKIDVVDKFVSRMTSNINLKRLLHNSYIGSEKTVLEDEWELIKQNL
tara:strand:- start:2190 stop:2912 length:723 start_codon:yes stop_codon:yes gene_type:complete